MEIEKLHDYQQALLSQIYSQGFQQNEENTKTWTKYRDKHKSIIQGLETFVSELSLSCVVPLGKRAFMKGRLTHTNEILVSIGDGYFVKYSAQQAIALCNRRIKRAEEMLESLEKEKNLLQMRQTLPLDSGAFEHGDCKELVEFWDEKKIEDWRVEHRKKEKDYRENLSKIKDLEKTEIQTEEDLFKRLDYLELEEELADELNRLEEKNPNMYSQFWQKGEESNTTESSEDDDDDDDDDDEEEEQAEDKQNETKVEIHLSKEKDLIEKDKTLLKEESNNAVISEQRTCNVNLPSNEQKEENIIEKKNDKNKNEVNEKQIKNIPEPTVKDTKINGKFEVSIISEEEIQRIMKGSSSSTITHARSVKSSKAEKCNNEKKTEISFSHPDFVKSQFSPKKSKSSNRRVSFGEPRYIEAENIFDYESDSSKNDTLDEDGENSDDETIIQINFEHSNTKTVIESGNSDTILSPKDIYRLFCQPKSILKRPLSNCYVNQSIPSYDYNVLKEEEEPPEEMSEAARSAYNIVVQDIQERSTGKSATENSEPANKKRPISRFKLERSSVKK